MFYTDFYTKESLLLSKMMYCQNSKANEAYKTLKSSFKNYSIFNIKYQITNFLFFDLCLRFFLA